MFRGLASVVGPRMRATTSITALVVATVAVATTLVAAVPVYAGAVDAAALRLRLDETPSEERGVLVTSRASAQAVGGVLDSIEDAAVGDLTFGVSTLAFARTGSLDTERDVPENSVLTLGMLADRERHLTDVDSFELADVSDRVPIAMHADAAEALGLAVGDSLDVELRGVEVDLVVASTYRPTDRNADVWFSDPAVRDGSVATSSFVEYAPFLMGTEDFSRLDVDVAIQWRGAVGPDQLTVSTLDDARTSAREFDSVDDIAGVSVDVSTGLPSLLGELRDELDSGRAVILTVLVQVVAVALAATAIGGGVAAHARRREVALLRMRGASVGQLLGLALLEALIVVVPAVAVGPVFATAVVRAVDDRGPLRTAGLALEPQFSASAFFASALVGAAAVILLVAPSVQAAFRLRGESRPSSRGDSWLLRNRVDLVLSAAAVLMIWRLSGNTAATRGASGRLGADPLLLVAPGLAILTGSFVTLRLVRLGSSAVGRLTRRRRSPVAHLAAASARRRPSATSRVATLVVMAVGVGVFTSMLAASWERSHADRADAIVVADGLATFASLSAAGAVESEFRTAALVGVPGVSSVAPVDVQTGSLGADSVQAVVVATDAARLDEVVSADAAERIAALVATPRRGLPLVAADGVGPASIEIDVSVATIGEAVDVTPWLTLVDRFGTLSRHVLDPVPATGGEVVRTLLLESDLVDGAGIAAPVDLVRIGIEVPIPFDPDRPSPDDPPRPSLDVSLSDVRVDGTAVGFGADLFGAPQLDVPSRLSSRPSVAEVDAAQGVGFLVQPGTAESRRATLDVVLTAESGEGGGIANPVVPALVSTGLADQLSAEVGFEIPIRVDGVSMSIEVIDVVDRVPFAVDEPVALMVDWASLQRIRFDETGRRRAPSSIVVAFDPGLDRSERAGVAEALAQPRLGAESVLERDALIRRFADEPVDVALLGALTISGGAAVVIALLGLALNAVVLSTDRRTTSAFLRAMGVPRTDVRRWLVAEIAPVVVLAVLVGVISGSLLARLGLDGLTLSDDGTSVVPAPVAVTPWTAVAGLVALVGGAALASPLVAIRLLRRSRPAEELRAGAGG